MVTSKFTKSAPVLTTTRGRWRDTDYEYIMTAGGEIIQNVKAGDHDQTYTLEVMDVLSQRNWRKLNAIFVCSDRYGSGCHCYAGVGIHTLG
jgi:hypothetical protein